MIVLQILARQILRINVGSGMSVHYCLLPEWGKDTFMLSGACLLGYEQPVISPLVLHTSEYPCKIHVVQLRQLQSMDVATIAWLQL